MAEPWCVLLVNRANPRFASPSCGHVAHLLHGLPAREDPLLSTLRRATAVAPLDRVAAVVAPTHIDARRRPVEDLGIRAVFTEPEHRGTAYEVLLALVMLENKAEPSTPIFFLPVDHVVDDDEVMANSLKGMVQWIADDPSPVYVLGAAPRGPHDQLGYILPWHDAMHMPSVVYEFVEKPDIQHARKLINAGGLWNTFIFGGTIGALLNLFSPKYDASIAAMRHAANATGSELATLYDRLTPIDFSRDVLAGQCDTLNVLRLPPCGWWPLKSPTPYCRPRELPAMEYASQRNT